MLPQLHNPENIDPALLTFQEYHDIVNNKGKMHCNSAYDYDLKRLESYRKENYPTILKRTLVSGLEFEFRLKKEKRGPFVKKDINGEHIRIDGQLQYMTDEEIQSIGIELYKNELAVFNQDKAVGIATGDEWGCILVVVVQEYRNFGLGSILQKMIRTIYPAKPSGGFTNLGLAGFRRVHKEFVKDAMTNGYYRKLIQNGTITLERVKEIVASTNYIPKAKKEPNTLRYNNNNPADWLLYGSEYGDFILYDKKIKELINDGWDKNSYFIESMMLGAVNVRELPTREGFAILTLFGGETDNLKKFMMHLALSFAEKEGLRLLIDDNDLVHIGNYAEKIGTPNKESGFLRQEVKLTSDPAPYYGMMVEERRFRKGFDEYREFENYILEIAYTKFRIG